MNQREELYQRIFMRQRRRYIIESGGLWPGRPEPARAMSCYPNILAELEASRFTLDKMAEIARVSPEVMAAVLEDYEELREREFRRLAYHLGVEERYLSESSLHIVEPGTDGAMRLIGELDKLIKKANILEVPQMWEVEGLKGDLKKGRPVTYSAYRWAYRRLIEAVECYQKRGGKYYGVRKNRINRSKS